MDPPADPQTSSPPKSGLSLSFCLLVLLDQVLLFTADGGKVTTKRQHSDCWSSPLLPITQTIETDEISPLTRLHWFLCTGVFFLCPWRPPNPIGRVPVLQRGPEDSLYPVIPLTLYIKVAELEGSSTKTRAEGRNGGGHRVLEHGWEQQTSVFSSWPANKLLNFPPLSRKFKDSSLICFQPPARDPQLLSEHLYLYLGDFHLHHLTLLTPWKSTHSYWFTLLILLTSLLPHLWQRGTALRPYFV